MIYGNIGGNYTENECVTERHPLSTVRYGM